jgi:hypothetical protein
MAASLDSVCESVRAMLAELADEDRRRFLEERDRCREQGLSEGSLLDQLCCVRLVVSRLAEGYAEALAGFEERLDQRSGMPGGWRKSMARKAPAEYESPMPWLHPFRLAKEDLEPLEEELRDAVARGETQEREPGRLRAVLERHELTLPLPSPHVPPRFPPGAKAGT